MSRKVLFSKSIGQLIGQLWMMKGGTIIDLSIRTVRRRVGANRPANTTTTHGGVFRTLQRASIKLKLLGLSRMMLARIRGSLRKKQWKWSFLLAHIHSFVNVDMRTSNDVWQTILEAFTRSVVGFDAVSLLHNIRVTGCTSLERDWCFTSREIQEQIRS